MHLLLLFTGAIFLADSFIGASQYKLSKATLDTYANQPASQGQGEYYVPTYFNPYQSYQQLLDNLGADQLEQYVRQAEPAAPSSRFPSIVSPSISLNGPDSLSKYKQIKSPAKPMNIEFRNLLASIKAIQPVVDERLDLIGNYIKQASQQQAAQRARGVLSRPREAGQAEYYENPFELVAENENQNQPRQKLLPFAAEAMASSYDEIKDAADANLDTSKRLEPKGDVTQMGAIASSMREPKARRKFTSSEPALLQNSRNLVLSPKAYQQPIAAAKKESLLSSMSDVYFVAIVACVSSVAIFSVIGAGYCFYKVQQTNKAAQDVEFPAYGVIGPASRQDNNNAKCSSPPADRKLAQSAQMYHYHHQKQQMISNEKNANIPRHNAASDVESEEENEDGEYTVYECPGLAPTGEMEVKNPLFQDDLTPMSPSVNGTINKPQESPKVIKAEPAAKGAAKNDAE